MSLLPQKHHTSFEYRFGIYAVFYGNDFIDKLKTRYPDALFVECIKDWDPHHQNRFELHPCTPNYEELKLFRSNPEKAGELYSRRIHKSIHVLRYIHELVLKAKEGIVFLVGFYSDCRKDLRYIILTWVQQELDRLSLPLSNNQANCENYE